MPWSFASSGNPGGLNMQSSGNPGGMVAVPQITTAGLVINLDAGNRASYPGSGTTWTDLTGNSRNATLINGPTFNSTNGGSIQFTSASSQYADIANTANSTFDFANTTFTVDVWVNFTSLTFNRMIVTKALEVGGWAIYGGLDGQIFVGAKNGTTGAYPLNWFSANSLLTSNAWYNLSTIITTNTTTVASNTAKVYLNGVEIPGTNSPTTAEGYGGEPSVPIKIGRRSPAASPLYLDGKIAAVKIYNRGLTTNEVFKNYISLRDRFGI